MEEFLALFFSLVVAIAVVIGVVAFFDWAIPDTQWCSVVTTTGEIESQSCPAGFNDGDRIYWDNEKHTYAKVG